MRLTTDIETIEQTLLPLFDEWINSLALSGFNGHPAAKVYAERNGMKPNDPLPLMFAAFCGGVDGAAFKLGGTELFAHIASDSSQMRS